MGCEPISLSLLRVGAAAHFKPVSPAHYDFITRGPFPHVGWEEESLPLVTGMLTELGLCC